MISEDKRRLAVEKSGGLRLRSNHMAKHGIAELRLEPGAFRRHDSARIGDAHQILDARREHRERAGIFAAVHELFQFRRPANAADKIYFFARARIVYAKQRREN